MAIAPELLAEGAADDAGAGDDAANARRGKSVLDAAGYDSSKLSAAQVAAYGRHATDAMKHNKPVQAPDEFFAQAPRPAPARSSPPARTRSSRAPSTPAGRAPSVPTWRSPGNGPLSKLVIAIAAGLVTLEFMSLLTGQPFKLAFPHVGQAKPQQPHPTFTDRYAAAVAALQGTGHGG
jgi:hypothetical protein